MQGRLGLVALADAVHASATADDAWAIFVGIVRANEFDRACLHVDLPLAQENPYADHVGSRTFGVLWDAEFDGRLRRFGGDPRRSQLRPFRQIRPTLMFLSRFGGPLMVDHRSLIARVPASNLAAISRIMLEDFGQSDGIVLPLSDLATGRCSTLSLWGEGPRRDFKSFAQARVGTLQIAGLYLRALIDLKWPLNHFAHGETARLSDRERQVLAGLASGAQIAAVASRLAISERSAHEYVIRARAKLGAKTRTEAIVLALTTGQL